VPPFFISFLMGNLYAQCGALKRVVMFPLYYGSLMLFCALIIICNADESYLLSLFYIIITPLTSGIFYTIISIIGFCFPIEQGNGRGFILSKKFYILMGISIFTGLTLFCITLVLVWPTRAH